MNFEVHLNWDGRSRNLTIESGRWPEKLGEPVANAAMTLLDLICDENHTARVAVSGQIADEGVETRAANSIHVSVYLGPEVESEAPAAGAVERVYGDQYAGSDDAMKALAADDIEDIPEEPPANPGPIVPPTPPGGTPGPTRG